MSGVKMHRCGVGIAVALFACVLSARSASAAVMTLDDVTRPGDPLVPVLGVDDNDTDGTPNPNELIEKAIDNTTDKFLSFNDYGAGFIVTPRAGLTNVRGIRLYSANDASERDPASFLLEGAASPNGPFTVIYGSDVTMSGGRNPIPPYTDSPRVQIPTNADTQSSVTVTFPNDVNYASYRVTFPTLRDGLRANSMQIGEVELLGTIIPEPASLGLLGLGALGLLRRRR